MGLLASIRITITFASSGVDRIQFVAHCLDGRSVIKAQNASTTDWLDLSLAQNVKNAT